MIMQICDIGKNGKSGERLLKKVGKLGQECQNNQESFMKTLRIKQTLQKRSSIFEIIENK